MGVRFDTPLKSAVGAATAKKLDEAFGMRSVADLMRHYPRRYERFGELTPLRELPLGSEVTVMARVKSAEKKPMRDRKKQYVAAVVTDGIDELNVTFFNAHKMSRLMVPGREVLLSGTVTMWKNKRQLTHPSVVAAGADVVAGVINLDQPIPIYPATKEVTSQKIRSAVAMVLDVLEEIPDPLPAASLAERGLLTLNQALQQIHRPEDMAQARQARHRLRFEEAFVLQAAMARRRAEQHSHTAIARPSVSGGLREALLEQLPFSLTDGQNYVIRQICQELAYDFPMHRLLQGEVGSGKTVVALLAMLAVVDAGGQAALLAPTEVLAAQHYRSINALLGDLAGGGMLGGDARATRVVLLTGSMSTVARRETLSHIAGGEAGIVIGTHALLQDNVWFAELGLVVVDEQHRFGVDQRDTLRNKAVTTPHLLVMTATPIPRTVAMTVFGDLEISTLREIPAGRAPIISFVAPSDKPSWYQRVWRRLREEVDAGHQAYVVCPRIGDDGVAEGETALMVELAAVVGDTQTRPRHCVLEMHAELLTNPTLAGLRIGMLHGRMPIEQRERAMADFAAGRLDVLVSTTIIEVGVDVPNATVMVIMDADRFGISQLHQLRGRVGRGSAGGICLLVTDSFEGTPSRQRLEAVAATSDGFELAKLDVEQRREGDVLGARQSGTSSLRLLRVIKDEDLIEQARLEAFAVVVADPTLAGYPALRHAIEDMLGPEQEAYLDRS